MTSESKGYTGGKLWVWVEMEGWVMQQESTGRSLASVSIFGLNGSYTAVATLQKLLQLTYVYRRTHTVPRTDRDIVFKRVEIRETESRETANYFVIKRFTEATENDVFSTRDACSPCFSFFYLAFFF